MIKNQSCFHFHDKIKIDDLNPHDNFIDKKSCENILIQNFAYKNLYVAKPFSLNYFYIIFVFTLFLIK